MWIFRYKNQMHKSSRNLTVRILTYSQLRASSLQRSQTEAGRIESIDKPKKKTLKLDGQLGKKTLKLELTLDSRIERELIQPFTQCQARVRENQPNIRPKIIMNLFHQMGTALRSENTFWKAVCFLPWKIVELSICRFRINLIIVYVTWILQTRLALTH